MKIFNVEENDDLSVGTEDLVRNKLQEGCRFQKKMLIASASNEFIECLLGNHHLSQDQL